MNDDKLQKAYEAVKRSERFQGTGSELHNIREALLLLIAHAEAREFEAMRRDAAD